MLVLVEGRNTGGSGKNPSEQGQEPTTNSTHMWHQFWESNPGHSCGRRVLSPLSYLCSPNIKKMLLRSTALGWNWSYLYSQFNWSFLEQTCPFIISKNFYLYTEKNEQNCYNQPAQLPFAHSEKLKTAGKFTNVHTSSTIALSKLLYFWMTACPMLSSMKLKQEKKSVDWKIQPLTRAAFKLNLSFSFIFFN